MLNNGIVTVNPTATSVVLSPAFGGDSTVITPDQIAADGNILHVVDSVLLPAWVGTTIADIAAGDPNNFSSLVAALSAANLVDAVNDAAANFTVFAPTNAAFDALASSLGLSLEEVLALPELSDILLYHVVGSVAVSSSLSSGDVPTLNGQSVAVVVEGTSVTVNGANVVIADVKANNGVIHVIDQVLRPEAAPPTPAPTTAPDDMNSDIPSGAPSTTPSGAPSGSSSDVQDSTSSGVPVGTLSDVPSDVPSDTPSLIPSLSPSMVTDSTSLPTTSSTLSSTGSYRLLVGIMAGVFGVSTLLV